MMKSKLGLVFILVSHSAISQTLLLQNIKIDSVKSNLDSILILGIGSTAGRIFLDNLGDNLIKDLKSNNIRSEYQYLGKTMAEAQKEFNAIQKTNFNAVLFFLPKDSSLFQVQTEVSHNTISNPATGNLNFNTRSTSFFFHQNFAIQLYVNEEKLKIIWKSLIAVTCDLNKMKICSTISKELVNRFKANKYIQ